MTPTVATSDRHEVSGPSIRSTWWSASWPLTQSYGPTNYTGEPAGHGYPHWHAGLDIGMPEPTPLYAPVPGVVVEKGLAGYGAQSIRFRLEDGHDLVLGHLDSSPLLGAHVVVGQLLAYSGGADNDDGNTSGAHLHFEIRPAGGQYGSDVDPTAWLTITPPALPNDDETAALI